MMGSVRCTAGCLLVTLTLFTVGRASDDCLRRRFAMKACIDSAEINFDELHNSSYGQAMCSGAEPMIQCVLEHRGACPNMPTFHNESGSVINSMMDSYADVCTGGLPGQEPPRRKGCKGSRRRFNRKMTGCHRPLMVNLREDQMCRPMKKVVKCMKKLLKKFRACGWMTDSAARQLKFGTDYFNAIRAVKYSCE